MFIRNRVIIFYTMLAVLIAATAHQTSGAAESGIARAKGHGKITFQGSGTISVDGDGVLYVNESPEVVAVGRFNFFEDEVDGRRVYIIQKNATSVDITGSTMDVSFSGANISFIAEGSGEMSVTGYGVYLNGLTFGIWSSEGTSFMLGN